MDDDRSDALSRALAGTAHRRRSPAGLGAGPLAPVGRRPEVLCLSRGAPAR